MMTPMNPLTFYLAARYERREEMLALAHRIEAQTGLQCIARWLSRNHDDADLCRCAVEDFEDVRDAHVFVAVTEDSKSCWPRGGRHVEFGLALSWGKPIFILGPRENVFHHLGSVIALNSEVDLIERLDQKERK